MIIWNCRQTKQGHIIQRSICRLLRPSGPDWIYALGISNNISSQIIQWYLCWKSHTLCQRHKKSLDYLRDMLTRPCPSCLQKKVNYTSFENLSHLKTHFRHLNCTVWGGGPCTYLLLFSDDRLLLFSLNDFWLPLLELLWWDLDLCLLFILEFILGSSSNIISFVSSKIGTFGSLSKFCSLIKLRDLFDLKYRKIEIIRVTLKIRD